MRLDGLNCSGSAGEDFHPACGWIGRMIAPLADKVQGMQASFVAKDFALKTVLDRAILYITAQGFTGLSSKACGWATRGLWCMCSRRKSWGGTGLYLQGRGRDLCAAVNLDGLSPCAGDGDGDGACYGHQDRIGADILVSRAFGWVYL